MFGSEARLKILEGAFLKHMDKEEQSFNHLIDTLDSIKNELHESNKALLEEIHNTNKNMLEYNSSHDLSLSKCKTEILEKVFDRVVEDHVYEKDMVLINKRIDEKASSAQLKTIWYVVGVVFVVIGFLVSNLEKIKHLG